MMGQGLADRVIAVEKGDRHSALATGGAHCATGVGVVFSLMMFTHKPPTAHGCNRCAQKHFGMFSLPVRRVTAEHHEAEHQARPAGPKRRRFLPSGPKNA